MSKVIKGMVTDELRSRYDGVSSACVVDITGLNVQEQQELRTSLREKNARMQIVKNSMVKRALKDGPLKLLSESLTGPCALIVSEQSIIDVAKVLIEASKDFSELKLKQAMMDGDTDLLTVVQLSKMKSLHELVADISMLISSPGRSIAGCLGSPQSKIAGCLKAIVDKAA